MTNIKPSRSIRAALAAGALTLACAAPALAAGPPAPVVAEVAPNDEPVSYAISVLDAGGATVSTLACDWVGYPGEEDMPCLAWAGDLGPTIDAITAAGGTQSVSHVLAPAHDVDTTTRISPRGDGTWLLRVTGVTESGPVHLGRVCDAQGLHCVAWDVKGEAHATKAVKRAAAKLRKRK